MKFIFLLFIFISAVSFANDGAFFTKGNQLIPIEDTDIAITKEVLTIRRIEQDFVEVTVAYTFMNSGSSKNVLVGFEAASPGGDVNGTPVNGQHPYMDDFTVLMNGAPLAYEVAIVDGPNYYESGKFKEVKKEEWFPDNGNTTWMDFYYVYHFNAHFKTGENTVYHTYRFNLANSVAERYSFDYVLTAANRWANKGIDDFTLIMNFGEFQDFLLENSFFESGKEWLLNGKIVPLPENRPDYYSYYKNVLQVYCRGGDMVFSKKNFHPKGEISIKSVRKYVYADVNIFDASKSELPFTILNYSMFEKSANEMSYKILRNLPYARRGNVFKTDFIQAFYETQAWYIKNPNYISNRTHLTQVELDWLTDVNEAKF